MQHTICCIILFDRSWMTGKNELNKSHIPFLRYVNSAKYVN